MASEPEIRWRFPAFDGTQEPLEAGEWYLLRMECEPLGLWLIGLFESRGLNEFGDEDVTYLFLVDGSPEVWRDWGSGIPDDKPLHSGSQ